MTIEQHFKKLAASQSIEGALLTSTKGAWELDGILIKTGPSGTRFVALLRQVADGFRPTEEIPQGWSPSTSFVCIGADAATRGQIATFRSSSWGGRHAFNALSGGFARLGCRQYPIVTLATAKRQRSGNAVIDPVFRVVSWTSLESIGIGGGDAAPALPDPEERWGKITITSGRDAEPARGGPPRARRQRSRSTTMRSPFEWRRP